ncbi:MAG: hypothetical protein ACYTGL_30020 [Planctomycetota bacterium]|jgi:hypothetical protein
MNSPALTTTDSRVTGNGQSRLLGTREIAVLSDQAIQEMSTARLAAVVRVALAGKLSPEVEDRLDQYDSTTLRRLVFQARRSCRRLRGPHFLQQNTGGWSSDWCL